MKDNRILTGSLCALGCEVLYGLSYLFTKQTAETASPLALLGWRFVVALSAMSLCVALGFIPVRLKGRRLGPLLHVALFCPCLYFIGETVGIRETTVTESGVFLACVPALSLLASTVILKKKPTKRQIIGILVTFLGVMTTVVAVGLSSSLSPVGYAALSWRLSPMRCTACLSILRRITPARRSPMSCCVPARRFTACWRLAKRQRMARFRSC